MIELSTSCHLDARNAACLSVTSRADGGELRMLSGSEVVATFALAPNAFEAPTDGTARCLGGNGNSPVSGTNALITNALRTATIDGFDVRSPLGEWCWAGSVTKRGKGGDIQLDQTTVVLNQEIRLTRLSYHQP